MVRKKYSQTLTAIQKADFIRSCYAVLMEKGEAAMVEFIRGTQYEVFRKYSVYGMGKMGKDELERKKAVKQKEDKVKNAVIEKYYMNGEFICSYSCLDEAADNCRLDPAGIRKALTSKRKFFGGFIWKQKID
jgi:hypothetical protein